MNKVKGITMACINDEDEDFTIKIEQDVNGNLQVIVNETAIPGTEENARQLARDISNEISRQEWKEFLKRYCKR